MFYPSEAIVGRIEDFGNGVTREFAHNGHIVIVTRTGTISEAGVDTWFDVLVDTYRKWEPGKPLLLLSDMSDPAQGITTYSRQRAQDFTSQMRAGIPVYMALVLPNGVMANMMNNLMARSNQHPTRAFTKREEALAWLRKVALTRTQVD